jgi:hypothetical protein
MTNTSKILFAFVPHGDGNIQCRVLCSSIYIGCIILHSTLIEVKNIVLTGSTCLGGVHHTVEDWVPLPLGGGSVSAANAVVALQSSWACRSEMVVGQVTLSGHASTGVIAHLVVLFFWGHFNILELWYEKKK